MKDFDFDLDKSINNTIAYASTLLRRQIFLLFKKNKVDITPDQWMVLYYLWRQDGLNLGELAQKTNKDNANITRIVNRMEKQGLLRKVGDGTDKRFFYIHLTDKANTIKGKVYESILKSTDICAKGLSKEEQEFLLVLLKKIISNMKSYAKAHE